VDFKDYYAVLGVGPEADAKTIKQAYRKLARQYHPDVNPENKDAEEKFKALNEANQVLSDPEQRKKYDALRADYLHWQQSGGRRPEQAYDWQRWNARPGDGVHVQYSSPEDMEDLFGAQSPFSDFFSSIFGQAAAREQPSRPRRGRDIEYELEVSLEEASQGTTRGLQVGERRIEAKIPPGVQTGSRVRLAGQGEAGAEDGPPGDLYLVVRVQPHPRFEREGDDLFATVPVDIYTAVVGGEVTVPTLDRPVVLKIPPGTQADRTFRLQGKGMPHLGKPGPHGNLYLRVKLVLPEALSEQEVNAIRELAAARQQTRAG
jgi:curved DNA-binding protein